MNKDSKKYLYIGIFLLLLSAILPIWIYHRALSLSQGDGVAPNLIIYFFSIFSKLGIRGYILLFFNVSLLAVGIGMISHTLIRGK